MNTQTGKDEFMLITQVKKKSETKPIHVKCSQEVLEKLQEKADLYANGNLSEWLRYAGMTCVPPKSDLVQTKQKTKKK